MAFPGWSPQAVEFYEGLETDNSKAYWQAHRSVYEERVRAPMEELLTALAPQFGEGRIFRPYRDVRFSADKSPYKTAIGATLAGGGYVQFSADGLGAACGMYQLASDQLDRYRCAVADDHSGAALVRLTHALRGRDAEITAHDAVRTAPRGYPKGHPRIELLRLKGLVAWKTWPPETAAQPSVPQLVTEFLRDCAPVQQWLDKHVGASRLPADRRR